MEDGSGPSHEIQIQPRAPAFQATGDPEDIALQNIESAHQVSTKDKETELKRRPKSLAFEDNSTAKRKSYPDVYLGSYGRTSEYAGSSFHGSISARSTGRSAPKSPRASASQVHLQHLLRAVDVNLNTYGLSELRDGFFDASFYRPLPKEQFFDDDQDMKEHLPPAFRKYHPLSFRRFIPQQWREFKEFVLQLQKFSLGIRLLKSFLGFFIAYIICLIPVSRNWLGRYNYIMVISTIVNHPGRPVGSQLDGAFMTTFGTIAGLGWGSLALYVSTSTGPARLGYGGVLATFLLFFAAVIAWLRYTGSRSLALAYHDSLLTIQRGLELPRHESPRLRRDLAWTFVKLSTAVRDFTIELTISRFHPDDARSVRNLIQGVIRGILSIRPETTLFDITDGNPEIPRRTIDPSAYGDSSPLGNPLTNNNAALGAIAELLAKPTRELIDAMLAAISCSDLTLALHGGVKKFGSVSDNGYGNLTKAFGRLQACMDAFDAADRLLVERSELPLSCAGRPEIVNMFLFVHPIRQTADKVQQLLRKIIQIDQRGQGWRINFPTYPFVKSLNRANAQVRHDRGGLTAGFYFRSKQQLEKTMADIQYTSYAPRSRSIAPTDDQDGQMPSIDQYRIRDGKAPEEKSKVPAAARYRLLVWRFLHRLQGFESRFAFKVALVTTLLSVPAWLQQSRGWWNDSESWWAVVTVWMMMHPRVGGTFQDLWARSLCAALGAIWAGFGLAAGSGNPYVLAVFAALFMFPMLHRFTQSSHPRSGIVGCISFTVVSLGAYTNKTQSSITQYAWTRGTAFIVGIVAALLTNWILWPFIARHELRKSLSTMMLHSAILYRGVVARYIYYTENNAPGPADIERSEMLECRLREGFVRMRQLLELTRHEIRLRAPFNPVPYSALIDASERFFEHLVEVRQSSTYFQPFMLARGASATNALFEVRRDAVAVILFNLYSLACALRADQPVPRYLPSAAAARQRLLDRMKVVEAEHQERDKVRAVEPRSGTGRRWADVYQYAFSSALTEIVEELQLLQRWTKEIFGEIGFNSDITGEPAERAGK